VPAAWQLQQFSAQVHRIRSLIAGLLLVHEAGEYHRRDANTRHPFFVLVGMNEYSQPGFGKISVHGDGMGAPTTELVEKRAREIALINERNPDEYTDADWDQAEKELLGRETVTAADDVDEIVDSLSDRDSVPGETGRRAGLAGEDDEMLGAQLVEGGIEEAAHDQMVEAAQDDQSAEG
jgi:hypothetical protein